MRAADVVVVGGGVIGCAVAWGIAKEGASVTLVERDTIGAHASSVAAGMLAPLTEATVPSVARRPGEAAFLELALRSLDLFPFFANMLREASGIDVECAISGLVRVAQSPERKLELGERFEWLRTLERGVVWLDEATLGQVVPSLRKGLGAIYSPQEGHVQSRLLVQALAKASAQNGATIVEGSEVVGFTCDGDRVSGVRTASGVLPAEHVVIASGPWRDLTGDLGYHLPVTPEKGQLLTLRPREALLGHILFGDDCYLVPRLDGSLVVGATAEDVGYDARPSAGAVDMLLKAAIATVPALADAQFIDTEAGLRPKTPDRLPLLGPVPGWRGVSLAVGHYRNGVLLSAITGQLMAELVLEGRTELSLEAFSPARFATQSAAS